MSTAIGAAMFGGKGCDPMGSAVQVQVIGVMYFSTGSGLDQHTLATMSDLNNKDNDESKSKTH